VGHVWKPPAQFVGWKLGRIWAGLSLAGNKGCSNERHTMADGGRRETMENTSGGQERLEL